MKLFLVSFYIVVVIITIIITWAIIRDADQTKPSKCVETIHIGAHGEEPKLQVKCDSGQKLEITRFDNAIICRCP